MTQSSNPETIQPLPPFYREIARNYEILGFEFTHSSFVQGEFNDEELRRAEAEIVSRDLSLTLIETEDPIQMSNGRIFQPRIVGGDGSCFVIEGFLYDEGEAVFLPNPINEHVGKTDNSNLVAVIAGPENPTFLVPTDELAAAQDILAARRRDIADALEEVSEVGALMGVLAELGLAPQEISPEDERRIALRLHDLEIDAENTARREYIGW